MCPWTKRTPTVQLAKLAGPCPAQACLPRLLNTVSGFCSSFGVCSYPDGVSDLATANVFGKKGPGTLL